MSMTVSSESLAAISLFTSLGQTDLDYISTITKQVTIRKNAELFAVGDESSDVYFVFSGKLVAKYYSETGREITYVTIPKGNFLGEFSAIDRLPRSATIICEEDATLGVVTSKDFNQLLLRVPEVSLRLVEKLVEKNRRLVNRIFESTVLTVQQRICREILRVQAQREKHAQNRITELTNFPTHYQIATSIGSHREAVTRELSSLEDAGIITSSRKRIQIKRQDLLRMLADV